MKDQKLRKFHDTLTEHKETLLSWLNAESGEKSIQLGGASHDDVHQMLDRLKAALDSVEKGDFGQCQACNGEVEVERLEADYSTCVCLSHYSEQQLRSLENELELVAKVQRDLMPCNVPDIPGLDIAAGSKFAGPVGGDYYDFFRFKDGRIGVTVADVMDKGLPASMLAANLQASVRILGPQFRSPHDLSHHLNHLFECNLNLIKFITIMTASLDLKQRVLEYCNAGHHPPLHWSPRSERAVWLQPTGPAIGLTRQPTYSSNEVTFSPGDIFVFYTDGLVEARTTDGDEFGEQRLLATVQRFANNPAADIHSQILDEAERFSTSFHDDVTLLIVKIGKID